MPAVSSKKKTVHGSCPECRSDMSPLGVGHYPNARLPDSWPDRWRNMYYWWNRLEKERVKTPSPFSGFFMVVYHAKERWLKDRRRVRDFSGDLNEFKLDPALHEAIRHAFNAIMVATQELDYAVLFPHTEWIEERPVHRFNYVDWIVNDYIDGWIHEETKPDQPQFLSASTICANCSLVVTQRK